MKTSILCTPLFLLLAASAPDPTGDGVKLYAQGKYKEAVAAFQKALALRPDDPRLNYNLALALWRSGDPFGAEAAVEKAALGADGSFDGLRDGILGNLRYDRAKVVAATAKQDPQKEVEVLEEAVQLAGTARGHFQTGAVAESGRGRGAELVRNLERAIKLEEELKKQLEDAKKRREEQKKKDEQNKKNDQKKQDDKKDQQKQDEKKQDDPDKKDQKPDEQEKEEKKDDKEPDEKKKNEEKKEPQKKEDEEKENKPHEAPKPEQAPGEHDPNLQLSPEQKRQLLKKLKDAEKKLQTIRAARKARRPKVKKDW